MSDIQDILAEIGNDDPSRAEQLLPLLYDELRKLAEARLARERPDHTLAATALVHEAYLRLLPGDRSANWDSRGHFFAAASEAMRRILVDSARRKSAKRNQGWANRVTLPEADILGDDGSADQQLIQLDESLCRLANEAPQKAELVKLRFFAGLSIQEAAKTLGISTATADRHWKYARAWLQHDMRHSDD